jgi:hypothetical protein
MDVLLLWDFSPGRAIAAQVRRKFNSPVHFSPSSTTKVFFLVAHFHYSSFPLSEEAVGVALECCLGGSASGFGVIRLSDKRFWFSVASNKLGHFIYSLRERCWPDFHCSFSLFRGDGFAACYAPKVNGSMDDRNPLWHSNSSPSKSMPSPIQGFNHNLAISTKLDFLKSNAFDGSSSKELAKFNLNQKCSVDSSLDTSSSSSPVISPTCNKLRVGEVDCIFLDAKISQIQNCSNLPTRAFIGNKFQSYWYWLARFNSDANFSRHKLEMVRDLRQAGYNEFEIQQSIGLWGLPPDHILNKLLGLCEPKPVSLTCANCLVLGHSKDQCVSRVRCRLCKELGHMSRYCLKRCLSCHRGIHLAVSCPV